MSLGAGQFAIGLTIAQAFHPGFNVSHDFLGDLGLGPMALPFNASIALFGLALLAASPFLFRGVRGRGLAIAVALAGIGALGFGLIPATDADELVHTLFSFLAFTFGAVSAIVAFGILRPPLRYVSAGLGTVSLIALGLLVSLDPDVAEISALLASAGHRVRATLVQRRPRPDPRTFVGRGKLDEIRDRLAADPVDVVVFNGELRPTMHHLLERELHVECYDRLRVLLELFAQRASSREGKLQVELALLQYEVPLLREWIHEADIGERPGFMAGGEQRVDAYLETVKRRIKRIRDELESIRRGREARRTLRKERGYHLVALAGYANAGKTSLLNALADERLLVEDRMFSTLSTATRSLTGTRKRILLTDTIGFVDGVPFWMAEAFQATLEEILHADLVLLLLDATDPDSEIRRKVRLAARTLF